MQFAVSFLCMLARYVPNKNVAQLGVQGSWELMACRLVSTYSAIYNATEGSCDTTEGRAWAMREPMVCGVVKSKGVPSTDATSPLGIDALSTGR